jgi:hypothetical protein
MDLGEKRPTKQRIEIASVPEDLGNVVQVMTLEYLPREKLLAERMWKGQYGDAAALHGAMHS